MAWTSLGGTLLLVPLDGIEREPSTVVALDVTSLLATSPLAACGPAMQTQARIPYALPRPLRVLVEGAPGRDPLGFDIVEAVLRVLPNGTGCISALLATGQDAAGGRAAVAMSTNDLEHSTLFHLGCTDGALDPMSCRTAASASSTR
jgi:hypothetical protein